MLSGKERGSILNEYRERVPRTNTDNEHP